MVNGMTSGSNLIACCGERAGDYWRGNYCRCCGTSIRFNGMVVGCVRDEKNDGACPHCDRLTCGAHSYDGSNGQPVRRHCELCGVLCDQGACSTHGMNQA